MTDTLQSGANQAEGADAQPQLRVLAQFIRDLSFENPNAPESLRAHPNQPNMDVGVELNARTRPDGLYEVDLKITAGAQREDQAVFHCELLYGGLFQITGMPEEDIEPLLMIECPRLLFPFVRQIIAEMTLQSGFPPFMLDPLDFAGIYMAQREQRGALAGSQPVGEA